MSKVNSGPRPGEGHDNTNSSQASKARGFSLGGVKTSCSAHATSKGEARGHTLQALGSSRSWPCWACRNMSQGMAVSNYKADEKEATRNRKKLQAIIKLPQNTVCADCPVKCTLTKT